MEEEAGGGKGGIERDREERRGVAFALAAVAISRAGARVGGDGGEVAVQEVAAGRVAEGLLEGIGRGGQRRGLVLNAR